MMLTFVSIICVVFSNFVSATVREQSFVKRDGYKLLDHSYAFMDARSAISCNRKCADRSACLAVNYNPITWECQLCDETPVKYGTKTEANSAWNLYHARGPCDAGWIYWGTSCYWLETTSATWSDSAANCAIYGARLLEIADQQENDFVFQVYQSADLTDTVWHGLNDIASEGEFVWPSGDPVNFLNFGAGEGTVAREDCMCIGPGEQWGDLLCSKSRYSICEKVLP